VILVDSSAWIELLRGTGSPVERRLAAEIEAERQLLTIGPIVLEILAGARDEPHTRKLRALLARCRFVPLAEPSDHEAAAALYRACRRGGSTIRRLPDCLVATVAIRVGAQLLHRDSDFEQIARHAPLELASP
jgi:predicted nucleic acid-binding protein